MSDFVYVCFYCADVAEVSDEMVERIGEPECCDSKMARLDLVKLYAAWNNFDKVKEKLGEKIVKQFEG